MVKVILEIASNGVIKTICDDNINGAGDKYERKVVYDFDADPDFDKRIKFLYDLCEEIGLETGNRYDKVNMILKTDWGKSYMPNEKELDAKIRKVTEELKSLKSLKKDIDELNEKN
jgi:hypothetical protein